MNVLFSPFAYSSSLISLSLSILLPFSQLVLNTRRVTHADGLPEPSTAFDHKRVIKLCESVWREHCSNRLTNMASEEQKSHAA